ncbi:hypothetical protein FT637_12820 [Bacillus cereus]|nr:hypothetical protein [Bacillus cereus]
MYSLLNYEIDQQQVLEKLGRNVPTYHLIDVWKFLKEQYGVVVVIAEINLCFLNHFSKCNKFSFLFNKPAS